MWLLPFTIFAISKIVVAQRDSYSSCICVPFYHCEDRNGTLVDLSEETVKCSENYQICCNPNKISSEYYPKRPPVKDNKCGTKNIHGRVASSDIESNLGEFPWMAAIMHRAQIHDAYKYRCGASLIHPEVVLTAAHCVTGNVNNFKIRLGEWDFRTTQEDLPHQERKVSFISRHPGFNNATLYNDIALVFLQYPAKIQSHINLICLPPSGADFIWHQCTMTGWGKVTFDSTENRQRILKKTPVRVLPGTRCLEKFRKTILGEHFLLHKSFICAGGEEFQDACTRDGGSPLVCPVLGQEGVYQQAGIVAWGLGCGLKDVPGAYVDVAMFRDWIDEELLKGGLDNTVYDV